MKKITLNNNVYELIKDKGNCFNLDEYIENYCAYGANYFLLKKIK